MSSEVEADVIKEVGCGINDCLRVGAKGEANEDPLA